MLQLRSSYGHSAAAAVAVTAARVAENSEACSASMVRFHDKRVIVVHFHVWVA